MDYKSPKVRIIENFIDKETCQRMIELSEQSNLWSMCNDIGASFPDPEHRKEYSKQWDDRIINLDRLCSMAARPELIKITWEIKERSYAEVMDFFQRNEPLHLETWEMVKWYYPIEQSPHVDYINPDFNRERDLPDGYNDSYFTKESEEKWRIYNTTKHYTSMLYLNEDFEGGELYFPTYDNFTIKPKPGLLVIFEGTVLNPHGVTQVTNGTRYVNTAFWCRNPTGTFVNSRIQDNNLDRYWERT
jgi:hypothetical protein